MTATMLQQQAHSNDSSKLNPKLIGTEYSTCIHVVDYRVSKDAQLLARYVNTQYTGQDSSLNDTDSGTIAGFHKLIKKHKKWCGLSPNTQYSLSSQFLFHLETQHPFHRRINFQHIMRQLSTLYNTRLDSNQSTQQATALDFTDFNLDQSMQSAVTYWVHNDNQIETELFLLKHLTLQLPSSPVYSRNIERSVRTAYLDSSDWSVYNSLVSESPNEAVQFNAPQILWEENSKKKDVVFVMPFEEKYIYLPMKRKNLTKFLSTKEEELDLKSPEWAGSSMGDWPERALKVRQYIHSSSLHPSTRLLPLL